jgi:hypothetical protein
MNKKQVAQVLNLRRILEANADAQLLRMSEIGRRESALRSRLSELRAMVKCNSIDVTSEMKVIGADVSIDLWVERSISIANTELSRVLVEKEYALRRVRREFGKKVAADEVYRQALSGNGKKFDYGQ